MPTTIEKVPEGVSRLQTKIAVWDCANQYTSCQASGVKGGHLGGKITKSALMQIALGKHPTISRCRNFRAGISERARITGDCSKGTLEAFMRCVQKKLDNSGKGTS